MTRRLKDRLAKIETGTTADMTHSDKLLLVAILARRDALFWPWRFTLHDRTPHCEIRTRQREYLAGSVGLTVKADGRAAWKDAHAARQRLIAAGMITANYSGGQVQSVFLSPLGEAYARALVGDRLHTVADVEPVFIYLVLKAKEAGCNAVRESVVLLVPSHGNPEDWNERTELMLPLLVCGAVEAQPDTQGRILYCPRDVPAPPQVAVDAEPHEDFDDHYVETFNGERLALSSAEPRDPHAVFIPIPASVLWPDDMKETHEEK
jgi:hypothetical protein